MLSDAIKRNMDFSKIIKVNLSLTKPVNELLRIANLFSWMAFMLFKQKMPFTFISLIQTFLIESYLQSFC